MSTDLDQVRLRMVAADPAPLDVEPPAGVMTADVLLDLIDERSGTMPTETVNQDQTWRAPQRPWRPAWAFAGAFVLLLVVIGVVVAAVGNDAPEVADSPAATTLPAPVTTLPSQTTAAPTTAVTTSDTPTATTIPWAIPPEVTWELVMPAGVDGIQFWDVLSDGDTAVAIGEVIVEGAAPVWQSENGFDWEPFVGAEDLGQFMPIVEHDGFTTLTIEDTSIDYGHYWMSDAVRGAPGWIAVGGWELDGRIWISPDGESWTGVTQTPFAGTSLTGIVAGGPGYVAVGSFHGIPDGDQRAAVFVSSTGFDWQLVDLFADRETMLGSIHVDPSDGSLLAFGSRAVWRSETGLDWTPIHHRDALIWVSQPPPRVDVVWLDDMMVAAGGDPAGAFSLWYSYDEGATWIRHDPNDPVFGGDVGIYALVEHEGKVIAVGSCNRCTTNLRPDETPRVDAEWGVIWVGTPHAGG